MFRATTRYYIPEDITPHGVTSQKTAQLLFESHKILNLYHILFLTSNRNINIGYICNENEDTGVGFL
jgi:hypothetical protein